MARRRKMDPERKAFINSLLEHYQPKDAQDANYVQTECQFRYCGTAIPFLTVRSTAR